MATQTVEFGAPAGQTVTARLFAAGSDTVVATASATARTNATGVYTAAFTNLTPGLYRLIGTNAAGTLLCQWWTLTESATATYPAYEVPPSIVADAVLDEMISQHLTPGSLGWAINLIRKANTTIDGTVAASPAPTTTTFKLTGADYPTGAMQHSVLFFEEGTANIELQNSPILTWTNNGDTTVTVVLEEPLTNAPQAGDVVLILPQSHVHAIADIQAGLSTLTAGQVNTEVVDALSVDTYAEPTAVPAATSSLKDKLNWLFMLARNRLTQTPTTQTVFRDDTTTPAATSTVSDNGTTATRGEFQ